MDGGAGAGAVTAGAGAGGSSGASGGRGTEAQAASVPTMAAQVRTRNMWIILAEALLALVLLVGIVWWTMFSGRKGGEPPDDKHDK
jgi:cobalamin biosynthesis Mg chelatase CobN